MTTPQNVHAAVPAQGLPPQPQPQGEQVPAQAPLAATGYLPPGQVPPAGHTPPPPAPGPVAVPQPDPEAEARQIQAMTEGVPSGDTITMLGTRYRIGAKIGLMPLLRYAHLAKTGTDASDIEGLDAMYTLLKDCIHEDDWAAFEADAIAKKADEQDLMDAASEAIQMMGARPTQQSSGSADGLSPTGPTSTPTSSSAVTAGAQPPAWAADTVPVGQVGAQRP